MRSVVVVLPASMWAMMPMLRQRSNGTVRDTFFPACGRCSVVLSKTSAITFGDSNSQRLRPPNKICRAAQRKPRPVTDRLPAIVREGLVGFGHAVDIFFLLHRGALAIGGVEQL